jgi:hypothetical protein
MKSKIKLTTVKEFIFYSYANLAMAHMAIENNHEKYGMINYMVRAKLFKGLKSGEINIRSIFDDEKIKITTGQKCNYCGSEKNLALDHIFPKKLGGLDNAENLVLACRSCNSSKGKKDLIEWMYFKGEFLPIMIIRRYLKLTYNYCSSNNLLELDAVDLKELELPFNISLLPTNFPRPKELKLNIE